MQTPWAERYAQRTQRMRSSAVRELLKLTELPDVISFAGGLPAPEVFPGRALRRSLQQGDGRRSGPGRSSTAAPRATRRCAR